MSIIDIIMIDLDFKMWIENVETKLNPKVLWITGMGSTGLAPKQLASMGYEVKSIGTTTNRYAAYLGRFKRYPSISRIFGGSADRIVDDHLKKNVEKHDREIAEEPFVPDVVVGTSQGGAVAIQVAGQYPEAKFVLGAPAWKIFNANPSRLPQDTIIIHGNRDFTVPLEDSKHVSDKFNFNLRVYDMGHTIPLEFIKNAVDDQLSKKGIKIPD